MKNNLVAMILSLSLAGIAIAETGQEPGRRNSAKQRIVKTTSVQVSAYDQLIQNGVQPEDLYSYPSEFWARGFYFDRSTGELLVATSRDYDLDEAIRKGVVSQDATSDTGKITGNVFVIERLLVTDVSVNADSGDVQFAASNGTIDIHAIREGLLLVKVAPVEDTFDFHPMRFHIRLIAQPDQKDAVRALRAPMPKCVRQFVNVTRLVVAGDVLSPSVILSRLAEVDVEAVPTRRFDMESMSKMNRITTTTLS